MFSVSIYFQLVNIDCCAISRFALNNSAKYTDSRQLAIISYENRQHLFDDKITDQSSQIENSTEDSKESDPGNLPNVCKLIQTSCKCSIWKGAKCVLAFLAKGNVFFKVPLLFVMNATTPIGRLFRDHQDNKSSSNARSIFLVD